MSGLFYNLGRHWGHKAVPALRKSKWIWDGLTGSEEEALRAEIAMGTSMAAEIRAATEPLNDEFLQGVVQEICQRLTARVRNNRRNFQCEVLREPFPNAMALPGGFIFVSNTLLMLCEREPDELAFVAGHEMAHVIRGHTWDRMLNDAALRVVSTVAARAGALGAWLRQQGLTMLRTAHSHQCETEADELGLRLALAAGYAPDGAIRLMQRLQQLGTEPHQIGEYFASHPPAAERSARLQAWARQIAQARAAKEQGQS